jgi:ABC-type lipoprotein release transport system permease subunit
MSETAIDDVKIFFDKTGKAREVLMNYETFLSLEVFLRELKRNNQTYFVAKEWQKRIREAEADIEAGRTYHVQAQDIEKALDWLDE